MVKTTGAQLLSAVLRSAGVDIVAGIPGHTIFTFANSVPDEGLRPLLVRHEAIATFAADVYFRQTGRLMAAFTHSIPGAANAVVGVANAYAESSSMLLITGETASDSLGRGAYQELTRQYDGDTAQWLRHVAKRVWQPKSPLALVENAIRALKLGPAGRPGPVVLDVFQQVWDMEVEVPALPSVEGLLVTDNGRPNANDVDRAAQLLAAAERPLIVAGNGVNLARAQAELLRLAEQLDIPVATTVTGKGSFPEDHRLSLGIIGWVGTAPANQAARAADVVFAIGSRMTESTTSSWQPGITFDFDRTRLIQSDIVVDEIANVYPVDAALVGHAKEVLKDLAAASGSAPDRGEWLGQIAAAKESWQEQSQAAATDARMPIQVGRVVGELRSALGTQPVTIVADVGKHHKWVAQQFEARAGDSVVSSMGAGTMGFGPCGAVGAALAGTGARTIAWTGDGGMSMVPFVLPTAAEYKLPIVFIVIDDGAYGAVANIQQERYGRTVYSEFTGSGTNPDFSIDLAGIATASGVPAKVLSDPGDLERSLKWALDHDGPVLLDIQVDRASVAPSGGGQKLSRIWEHPIHPWADRRASAT